jgi:hypothetical protein
MAMLFLHYATRLVVVISSPLREAFTHKDNGMRWLFPLRNEENPLNSTHVAYEPSTQSSRSGFNLQYKTNRTSTQRSPLITVKSKVR